ncbi:MAG: recombinase family protein [Clostridia bacterium]|nr:recombinase family protein [Clostridia bacterium]
MSKVAIYCRLSDEDRNKLNSLDDSESIQNQKNMLNKYAIEKGWDIYKIYSDDDFSGLDSDRPEWNKMLRDARLKKFDIVLCKSQSRFTRDMELVEKYIHNKFLEWGIRFIGVTDNADTQNKGNKKQRQIMGLTNEWYCEDISENIRAVFNLKRSEGQFIGSFAAYGYKKAANNKNKLIIDEEAAVVVRMIFNWYLEGYGTQHIAYMLNEKGYLNPTKYKQNAGLNFKNSNMKNGFSFWNKTTVKRILKNEIYIGNMVQGKREKVSYKSKKIISTSKEQWIRAENTHEAIIDEKTFHEVQRRISQRQRSTGEGQAHVFATKVRCADCGSTMNKVSTFRGNNKLYSYLRCKVYAITGNKKLCTSHAIRFDTLYDLVTERLKQYINDNLDEDNIAHRILAETNVNRKIQGLKNEISNIEKQLNRNSQFINNLYIDKVKGIILDDLFRELNSNFSNEKDKIRKRKTEIENQILELSKKTMNFDKWVQIVRRYKDFKELTHSMVGEFIEFIEIGEKDSKTGEQKVKIHWLF